MTQVRKTTNQEIAFHISTNYIQANVTTSNFSRTQQTKLLEYLKAKRAIDDVKTSVPRASRKNKISNKPYDVSIGIRKEFRRFTQLNKAKDTQFFAILYKKIHSPSPMRASMAYLLFEYLKSESAQTPPPYIKFFRQQLPFILEAIISIQYYHNQILDGKAGVTTPEKINQNLIVGNLLKDQLYHYIEQKVDLPKSEIPKLMQTVRSIFEWVDIGQYIEKHCNIYEAMQSQKLDHPFEDSVNDFVEEDLVNSILEIIKTSNREVDIYHFPFLESYLTRIYLTNATLYKLTTQLVADLLQIPVEEKTKIMKFTILFGIASQIVNDNCDFVPSRCEEATVAKTKNDALSDLRNNNITLPIFINLLKHPNGQIAHILKHKHRKCILPSYIEDNIFKEITESLSIFYSMKVAKEIAKQALCFLSTEKGKEYYQLLNKLSRVGNNRYYKHFYDFDKSRCYRQYQKESRSKYVIV